MSKLFEVNFSDINCKSSYLRSAYYDEGAVVVRQILPISLINSVALQIIDMINLLDPEIKLSSKISLETNAVNTASQMLIEVESKYAGSQSVIYDAMDYSPLMHQIASNCDLLKVIEELLSAHTLLHPRLIVLMSMPKETWHLARWHQDCYYNEGPESTCTVYAPLQHTNKKNGGLIIAKSELKNGIQPHGDYEYGAPSKWKTIPPDSVNSYKNLAQIDLAPGDVLFLHSLAPHTAQVNDSDDVRFVLNLRYRDMTDPKFKKNNWRVRPLLAARQALARKN